MTKPIEEYWVSVINISKTSESDEYLRDICNLYSEDYGVWESTGRKIKLTPRKFISLHKGESVYFARLPKSDEILGFFSVQTRKGNLKVITSGCVKKSYRNKKVATSILKYLLSTLGPYTTWRIGVVSPNPVFLLTLETYPDLEYIDLENEVRDDVNFGIQLSIFIDEFRRKSYSAQSISYEKSGDIMFKKINTGFIPTIPESEIHDGLKKFYENLMGELRPGEEWILFTKYKPTIENETNIPNTISQEIQE